VVSFWDAGQRASQEYLEVSGGFASNSLSFYRYFPPWRVVTLLTFLIVPTRDMGLAEAIFKELDPADAAAYCTIIRGRAKYFQVCDIENINLTYFTDLYGFRYMYMYGCEWCKCLTFYIFTG